MNVQAPSGLPTFQADDASSILVGRSKNHEGKLHVAEQTAEQLPWPGRQLLRRRERRSWPSSGCDVRRATCRPAHPSVTASATVQAVTFHSAATLSGPITTGHVIEPLSAQPLDLGASGYVEQEFFASGTATAFTASSFPSNGDWSITPTTSAPYETRILVRRPADPARFNGTVVVEWMNVTAGESAPDWQYLNPLLERDGYAWVGVSAQRLAVDGGKALVGVPSGAGPGSGGLVAVRAGTVRLAPPSGRSVRTGHVRPDREGAPCPERAGARRLEAQARRRRRRVAVGRLPDDVRRCRRATDAHLRRRLHPQPVWFGCFVGWELLGVEARAQ